MVQAKMPARSGKRFFGVVVELLNFPDSQCLPNVSLNFLNLFEPALFGLAFLACLQPDLFHFFYKLGPGDEKAW